MNSRISIFCDIDGTLIDINDIIRPYVDDLFSLLSMQGFEIYVWSAGGMDYASRQFTRILTYIKHIKGNPAEVRYKIIPKDFSRINLNKYCFAIDDQQEVINTFQRNQGDGFKVPFYDSNLLKDDDALTQAYHAIMERQRRIDARTLSENG